MNILKIFLEKNKVSAYSVSKTSGIPYTTINSALKDGKKLDGQTVKVLKAVALATNRTSGQLLDELIFLDEKSVK
ncbi:hypothetical protein QP094_06545 [Lactobacillus jensenii]|jgi:site-specific DNA methylase|uniref:hypothetical protein n=1 Tax=Lactobacillus TaxID=1578 RepID=UPI00094A39A5|nr:MULTISPECIES: hypothetical protein [Lactobacillus]DAX31990.1 MAG TPA: helix-turn-helix domain protein [Caudoviricetes sp.]APT14752.1 hypothetical protein BUE77_04735 [Lactobacillus jensenii]MCW8081802.1 hypothetical protein [Lactobacillus jensenii]MCW8106680.1 hypothetical protein [Lactobacillus mulieris]MDK6205152.1 hypothetical protein [Lactobacillus jensenii]